MPRTSDARGRLVESAMQLFHARSYGDVSVDELCVDSGVNKGSFYYYFPSKRDLALAAIDAHWQRTRQTLLEPCFASDLPPLRRIMQLFSMVAALHSARAALSGCVYGCAFGNLALEISTRDTLIRQRLQQVFDGYCTYFEAALREAEAAKVIEIADVRGSARAVLAFLEGALLLAKTANDAALVERLGEQIPQLVGAAAKEPVLPGQSQILGQML